MRSSTAQADISATALVVWAALTSPAKTERFLGGLRISSAWRPDAPVDVRHGTTLVATGTVVVADRPALLVYRLDEPQTGDIDCWLDWHLDETEPGITRVTLTADTLPADPPVDAARLLGNLKTYLEAVQPSAQAAVRPSPLGCCAAVSDSDHRPPDSLETAMTKTACTFASHPGIAEPEWLRAGQDLRDVALQLRIMLSSGTLFAIATVVSTYGIVLRQPGTVVVISESGETIGFNPAGPLDGAIRDLAAQALATGQNQLQRLEIDHEAASYIGVSGGASLDVYAMRVRTGDPMFGNVLRYLDSGAATVLVVGTCGISGHAVIGADRVVSRQFPGTASTGHRRRPIHTGLPLHSAPNLLPRR